MEMRVMVNSANAATGAGSLRSALDKDGYDVVAPGIEQKLINAVVGDIWTHVGADPANPASWYWPDVINGQTMMVEMCHYQSVWEIRQHPAPRAIFAEIHRTPGLWVSIDRVAFQPPVDDNHPQFDSPEFIHWATDTNRYPEIPLHAHPTDISALGQTLVGTDS